MKQGLVLINGGGLSGHVAALSLAQQKVNFELLEQQLQFSDMDEGLVLGPPALRVLEVSSPISALSSLIGGGNLFFNFFFLFFWF
jgi:2-polyprenyl-6-methoxyphenol hydroxylase-like FAD-dependent oxidoreductase